VWDGSESLSSTYPTRDLTITVTRKLRMGSMPLHYTAWCFLLRLPTNEHMVARNVWPSQPACSSYPQILETVAVKRLYELVSSDVPFGNSLLKFKLVILVFDRLCGLVISVSGYRYRGPGFDPRRYQIFWVVVGLEQGPLSLVRSSEELLEWKK